MIQVLALRPYTKEGQTRIAEKWFDKGIRVPSVDMLIADPYTSVDAIKRDIGPDEIWNVYYTVCECLEEPGRKFQSQSIVPFDIDGLDLPFDTSTPIAQLEMTARLACDAIGVKYEETAVIFSGNGLQLLIGLSTKFEDVGYFDQSRAHYRAICDRINLKLQKANILGKADPSVWSPARLLRHPETYNRKANKPERKSFVLQSSITHIDFQLEKASGLPIVNAGDHLNPDAARQLFNADPDAILHKDTGCSFLKHARLHQDQVSEPQWYAVLSLTERFPDAAKWSHEFSEKHPKYSYAETETKRRQAVASSGPRTCKNIEGLGFGCQTCPQFGKIHSPITIEGPNSIKTMNTGFYFMKKDKDGNPTRGLPDYQGLWKYFCRQHDYVSVADTPELYAFKERYWEAVTRDDILSFAHRNFKPPPQDRERREFYSFVKISNMEKRTFFDDVEDGLFNFQNGVYSMGEMRLFPHDKKYPFRHILPCDYDQNATSTRFLEFLHDVTKGRQELVDILQEFMGYAIAGGPCSQQKGLILLGIGANGKSTFVNILRAIAGQGASNLSAKDLLDDRKRLGVVGKILNIAEENSRDAFSDTSVLKNMVSGGVTWAKQLYSQPFEFRNRAKMIFLMNELPRNYDNTDGFYRRLIIVPFDAKFSKRLGNDDKKLESKLLEELPGIFNFALEGYKRLIHQGDFTESLESDAILEEYALDSDHVKAWLHESARVVVNEAVKTSKDSLYFSYRASAEADGIKYPDSKQFFFKHLKNIFKSADVPWKESKLVENDTSRKRFVHYIELLGPDAMTLHLDTSHAQIYRKT